MKYFHKIIIHFLKGNYAKSIEFGNVYFQNHGENAELKNYKLN